MAIPPGSYGPSSTVSAWSPPSTLAGLDDGQKVLVGGVVTHRQRPATAAGITFINLEDETGLINVVCSKGCWARYRRAARTAHRRC